MSEPRAPERGSERSGTGQPRRTVEDLDQPSRGVAPDHGAGDAGLRIMIRLVHMGPFLILVGFWILMSFLSPFFLETRNLSNLFLAAAIPTVLALGLLFVIITGGIDLSAGANFVLVAVCGARFTHEVSANPIATILFMLAVGGFVGLVNGLLIEHVRIAEPFVVTLGTLSVVTGAVFLVSSGLTVTGFPTLITDIGGGSWGYVPISAVVVVVIAMAAALALRQLRWGRWVYAVGSNREAATRVGMPVRFVGTSVFVLSGLAAGVAGIFEAGLTNAGTPAVGFTAIIDAITAVVIGGAALTGGRGTVWGTLVGATILQTIHNGMNLLRIDTNWEPVALGAVLLAAVGLEKMRAHLETRLRLTAARRAGDL
jgi:ribose transport system permease protein